MGTRDTDLPADTLLAWILEDYRGARTLTLWPARAFVSVPLRDATNGGFEEEEALTETIAVGTLDAEPADHTGWTLHFRIEDRPDSHLAEDEDAPREREDVTVEAFWHDFVAPGRGATRAWVTVETPEAMPAFDRFLEAVLGHRAPRQ